MDYSIESSPLDKLQSDCLLVGIYENQQLSPAATQLDSQFGGLLSKLIGRGDIRGKNAETLLINNLPDGNIARIVLLGFGERGKVTRKQYRKALAAAIKIIKDSKVSAASCALLDIDVNGADSQWKARQVVEVFNDGLYQYSATKKVDDKNPLQKLAVVADDSQQALAESGLQQGIAIARGMELAKHLADLPGNICTPTHLAEQALALAGEHDKLTCEILEESDMEALGMGSFLSVSRGSRQPAKLICLDYQGGDSNAKPIVLIGKGLTFDAGGISLKPGLGMDEMKYDMCGGASVLGLVRMATLLNLKLNIVGLIPASENLPDGAANKPGDIWTSMSGKTIEILNTDAEGRLILCDTLTYAKKYNPDVVIDMATLTGACIVALGRVPSGLFGNDDKLCNDLLSAGDAACDLVWRMPIWEEYQEQLKSNFADLANIGGPDGGSITAAVFLSKFAEEYRWAHIDIAGTAWRTGANKGATGRPVPLVSQYLLNRASA
ncbi:leucyl aminopeptidase [Methylomonas sp. EFPC1]|uniref:leucyl aminopeptidase n=1 Tax=unclassified Methylomonas TaxID=2608980 RepID=UPI00051B8018|nr:MULTISPECIES: leucyl aminopeptidase [unclassified Methylomonas]PKD40117.1 leucyl aminopeptidase [Methylomonas sp. Kb3]QBC29533.1 leucyl aminopeptidase [Methylomonas sp. LW13]QSB01568.1 leucyl aminopeptidase [Methylomonas sp. EFPC1]